MTNALQVANAARAWLGVRWVHQGRDDHGIDCAGLVIRTGQALGLMDFDTRDYAPQATDESMLALCDTHLLRVAWPEIGGVGVFRYGPHDRHMGIFGDYPGEPGRVSLIHASLRFPRRVVENLFSDDWLHQQGAQLVGCYRFPGVSA